MFWKKELPHCPLCTASFFSTFRCHDSLRVTESAGKSTAEPFTHHHKSGLLQENCGFIRCKTTTKGKHNLPHIAIDKQGGCPYHPFPSVKQIINWLMTWGGVRIPISAQTRQQPDGEISFCLSSLLCPAIGNGIVVDLIKQ